MSIQKYGYRAEEIFNKIIVDSSTISIYDKLILKLNTHEKLRLTEMLVNFHVENYQNKQSTKYIRYINPLKSQIGDDNLKNFCNELLKQVEKGREHHILALFEIFGRDLNMLKSEEQELIMTYLYNFVFSLNHWNKKIENSEFREFFSFLGLYLDSSPLKKKFFELLLQVVSYCNYVEKDRRWSYLSAYRNMISNFSNDKIKKCEEFIKEGTTKEISDQFFSDLEEDNDLPF